MIRIVTQWLVCIIAASCAACANVEGTSSSASPSGSVTMYGTIDSGVSFSTR